MAFNYERTAQILGEDALVKAREALEDPTLEDKSGADDKFTFCLDGQGYSSSALRREEGPPVAVELFGREATKEGRLLEHSKYGRN